MKNKPKKDLLELYRILLENISDKKTLSVDISMYAIVLFTKEEYKSISYELPCLNDGFGTNEEQTFMIKEFINTRIRTLELFEKP